MAASIKTLMKIFEDTFRSEIVLKNPETIKYYHPKQIRIIKKEVKRINALIEEYNSTIHALNVINDRKILKDLLLKADDLDDDIDFYLDLLNEDFKTLTAIVNQLA